ncbi:alpha/beta hydrolase family protein [Tenacibaculum halocynthiae]|uniref:alpha/beta hydrolase family protein n=1 Tax=Tenacibaculum halocynthiae TaxID=1254437 RepID=UPI003D658244
MNTSKQFNLNTPLGHQITITEFPTINSNNIVIILSATGVLQTYYYKFSKFLQTNNHTVYTFDYSGIGQSKTKPLTQFNTTVSNWATNDIQTVFQHIKKQHPTKNIKCIGHSLGGQLLGLVPSNKILDTVILVASQTNHYSFWNNFNKARVFFNWFVIFPFFTTFFKYFPSKSFIKMENLPRNVAREFSKWSQQKNYYFDLKVSNELFHHQISSKLIGYSCTNDKFAPKRAVDWMMLKYKNAKLTRKHLVPSDYDVQKIGHFGFFRSHFKNSIWQEFLTDLQT